MNKIIISDKVEFFVNDKIKYFYEPEIINKIKLKILKTTNLEIIYNKTELKLDITIDIVNDVKLTLKEISKNSILKIFYKYNLNKNSKLYLIKINDSISINSRNIINLNKEQANTKIILKTISKNNEKYDFIINHNTKNTNSDLFLNGINLNGTLHFNITSYITKEAINCNSILNNRIINFSDKECIIRPNLLNDGKANIINNSFLGQTIDELNEYKERKEFIKYFINYNINKTLADKFKKYWR